MQALFHRMFDRYGAEMTLGDETVSGFFHSVNSRSWQNMERLCGPLGEIPRGQYIGVLPASAVCAAGDTLLVGQQSYEIRRVEQMCLKGEPIYLWCLCVQKGGDDTW